MITIRDVIRRCLALLTLAAPGPAAMAAVLHVGPGCTYNTNSGATAALQAAINQARTNAGADTIALTGNLALTAMVTIRDPDPLTIEGGYASCSATASAGTRSTLDANTLATTSSVIYQDSDNGSGTDLGGNLTLRHLNVRNANSNIDPGSDLYGGAIYAHLGTTKSGTLSLVDVSVDHDNAGYGGGLYIEGSDQTHAKLNITDCLSEYNIANFDGGAMYASNTDITIGGDTELNINSAGGNGGGLFAQNASATVKVHMPTDRYFLNSNTATGDGGGLYLLETLSGPTYLVTMQNDVAGQPLVVTNNTAGGNGGGFYLASSFDTGAGNTSGIVTTASLYNLIFDTNYATNGRGAALYIAALTNGGTYPVATSVTMRQSGLGDAIPRCAPAQECNAIINNESTSAANYGAAVAAVLDDATHAIVAFDIARGYFRGNNVNDAVVSGTGNVFIDNSLIAQNTTTHFLVETYDGSLQVSNTTIAGNTLPAAQASVYALREYLTFYHNLVDQPGATVCTVSTAKSTSVIDLGYSFGTLLDACTGTNTQTGSPSFVDAANGDFHLRFDSEAINRWTPATSSNSLVPKLDLDGYQRPFASGGSSTPFDFGAYEYGAADRIFANGFEP